MSIKIMSSVWELDLKVGLKMVLLALSDHANDDGVCWPSYRKLQKKCSCSRSGLMDKMKKLEQLGYLVREHRIESNKQMSNNYLINLETILDKNNLEEGSKIWTGGVQNLDPGGLKSGPPSNEPSIEPSIKPPHRSPLAEAPTDDAHKVFNHWKERMNHPGASFDPKRRKLISTRLKKYSADQLIKAIDGCAKSEYHMGRGSGSDGTIYDKLSLILKNAEYIEDFINKEKVNEADRPISKQSERQLQQNMLKQIKINNRSGTDGDSGRLDDVFGINR